MIVVFDTSVWISALHFKKRQSPPILALERARNRHIIATCNEIEREIHRILTEKFGWEPNEVHYRLDFFLAKSVQVTISGNVHICRDPNDDMFVECAMVSGARCIVSGDKDLLVLDPFEGIRIVTPTEFLEQTA
ncbi:MAG: putative toxin-antitoxin system toxin component, PIN family [Terracidiphilus sp.]|jgi:putative PIN family toxin of toxin-antitoxin system